MPNRFASQQDYSQTFQYLVERNQQYLESAAQRADAQREANWAARDNLMVTRWQEGKISGGEMMAHIQSRLRQSITPEERDRWRALAVEYGNQIADQRAEAAYLESDDIGALVQHYARRLAGTKKGTPEYTQLAERLKGLRETRVRDNITNGARRIIRKIEKGQATKRDLLKFYRSAAGRATGDIKQEILDNIAELRGQIREEEMEAAVTEIRTKLDGNLITPQQAANQYDALLDKYNIANTNPADYATRRREIARWRATPSELEIDRMEQGVIDGTVSPDEYLSFIDKWAEKIAPYDARAAWDLRQAGDSFIEDNATPLEGGILDRANAEANQGRSAIEVSRNFRGTGLKYISQFDGSTYNGYNCGMAAGAMMAHAMGYTGLSGADLRALSGDTSGGTTVFQVAAALSNNQVGISAGDIDARSNWGFQEFIDRIASGSTAVLGGWTGQLPANLNSTTGDMGHSVFIAGYDPEKGFLVLDPSGTGKQKKAWWPAEVVRSFAFSGAGWQGGFNGYAAVSPPNTLNPQTLKRAGANAVVHIDVTAPPSGNVPGASAITYASEPPPGVNAANVGEVLSDRERRRLRKAGIKPGQDLDTKQEVSDLLGANEVGIVTLTGVIEQFIDLAEQGQMDEDGNVEMLDGSILNRDDINQLQEQLLFALDGQVVLYEAIDKPAEAAAARDSRLSVLIGAKIVNTLDENRVENEVVRGAGFALDRLRDAETPADRSAALEDVLEVVDTLAAIEATDGPDELDPTKAEEQAARIDDVQTGEETAEERMWGALNEVIENADQYEGGEDYMLALEEAIGGMTLDDQMGEIVMAILEGETNNKMLETGEAVYLNWNGVTYVVPSKESGQLNAAGEPIMVPDLSGIEGVSDYLRESGVNANKLPPLTMPGDGGEPVLVHGIPTVQQYKNLFILTTAELDSDEFEAHLRANTGPSGDLSKHAEWLGSGLPVNSDNLANLQQGDIQYLIAAGILTEEPFQTRAITVGDKTYWEGQTVKDGAVVTSWHEDTLPYVPYQPEDADLNIPGGGYVGTHSDIPGSRFPEPVNDPELMEGGTLGTDVLNFGLTDEASAEFVQQLQAEGLLPAEMDIPNPANPSEAITVTAEHPASPANTLLDTVDDFLAKQQATQLEAREKIASTLPPEEAAGLDAMTEAEMRERAQLAGVDYDTGQWLPGLGPRPEESPSEDLLANLGIVLPAQREDELEQNYFDHLNAAKSLAAAERANKAAAEAKAAEAAAKEEEKSSLPMVEPTPSAGKLPSLPKTEAKPKSEPPLPKPKGPMPLAPQQPAPTQPQPQPQPKPKLDITKPLPSKPSPKPKPTPQPHKPEIL